jgi:hypothetical protein
MVKSPKKGKKGKKSSKQDELVSEIAMLQAQVAAAEQKLKFGGEITDELRRQTAEKDEQLNELAALSEVNIEKTQVSVL